MIYVVPILGLASFLTVFWLCGVILRKVAQAREDIKDWKDLKLQQRRLVEELAEVRRDLSWHGNKKMVMY